MKINKMIKSSQHTTKFSNTGKLEELTLFICEYRRVAQLIVDDIWDNGYSWDIKGETFTFDVKTNQLNTPKYLDYNDFKIDTFLSGRALSSLVTQLRGCLGASVEKQRKRVYQLNKLKSEGQPKYKRKQLIKKIKQNIPQKPDCSKIKPELSSKCMDIKHVDGEFNCYIRLKSITKKRGCSIQIPIKYTKHTKKVQNLGGVLKNSILVDNDYINLRWELPTPKAKTRGVILGADQGVKDILTLSNSTTTPKACPHGHTLETIMEKMCRCKKGSNSFRRAQAHRKNFINWSINQLDLTDVKQINLEKVWNINYKRNTSSKLKRWTNTLIRDKVHSYGQEHGVHVKDQSCTYRSQRCCECGLVRKANRKGKVYTCKMCGSQLDADLNAARNHVVDLPEIPWTLRKLNKNRGNGFYWTTQGFFDLEGGHLEFPLPNK